MRAAIFVFALAACAHAEESDDDAGSVGDAHADAHAALDGMTPMPDAAIAMEATVADVATIDTGTSDATSTNDASVATHVVFASSVPYDGNLGGLSGADAKCQTLATAAGLSGAFKAWLSDSTTPASQRLTHASTPYVLVDSTVVANDWAGLTSGTLLHAINLDENGQTPAAGTYKCTSDPTVWTHTDTTGAILTNTGHCSDWSSTTATTTSAGSSVYKASPFWTNACQLGGAGVCAKTASLYCLEQ